MPHSSVSRISNRKRALRFSDTSRCTSCCGLPPGDFFFSPFFSPLAMRPFVRQTARARKDAGFRRLLLLPLYLFPTQPRLPHCPWPASGRLLHSRPLADFYPLFLRRIGCLLVISERPHGRR